MENLCLASISSVSADIAFVLQFRGSTLAIFYKLLVTASITRFSVVSLSHKALTIFQKLKFVYARFLYTL